ncbi:son RNA binding protein isoform X2 [Rhynchophorus ferrugineus]|uniref:son RNA binding protein isoform X2 n=1 Tax=Rhynchophorus ferrugineus TaxID=354439 RepID=UPI003FCC3AC3
MTTVKQETTEEIIKHDNVTKSPDIKKSSMEILSELFSTFDAEPPIIVKKEKKDKSEEAHRKSKKNKKKHKHKEKKHKKKSKKRKRSSSSSSLSSNRSEVDLANILIKEEQDKADKRIKIEGTSFSLEIPKYLSVKKSEEKKIRNNEENSDSYHNKEKYNKNDSEITDYISKDYKEKHKTSKRHKSTSRDRSSNKDKHAKYDDLRHKVKKSSVSSDYHKRHSRERECHRTEDRYKHRDRYIDNQERSIDDYDSRSKFREKESRASKDDSFYRHRDERSKDSDRVIKCDKWFMRERYRGYSRDRSTDRHRSRSREKEDSRIDKKKLLEIARRNAIQMMKSGSLPGALNLGSKAQEKMIAAIKSGGKTIEELTDFCKSLSKKEQLGELSSLSEKDDSDTDEPFHHPFLIKDRPTSITMNIKNSVPLPTKTTQERTTELRMQFPVSSGQQHRVNEEWVPVPPPNSKKTNPESTKTSAEVAVVCLSTPVPPLPSELPLPLPPLPTELTSELTTAPPSTLPGPQVFPASSSSAELQVDIGSIVSQRLTAMRKLQENPHDSEALSEIYKSDKESWAKSKQQLGQFTGTTGANILSAAELASGYQAWAKKDQLQTAAPVSGGMGMHLLQKMGWKPGEGLGKEKTGTLEPLLLEVKLDKKGLVANEEQSKGGKKKNKQSAVKTLQGKHPVSLLGEYASKKKLGAPQYILEFECGPDHKKNFLFKVILNGVEYKPNIVSASKKEAKANAASVALQQIGLLP